MEYNNHINGSDNSDETSPLNSNKEQNYDNDNTDLEGDVDTRSKLNFDKEKESSEEKRKCNIIEGLLQQDGVLLKVWRDLAIERCGLVNDDLRRKVWPLLLEIDPNHKEIVPSLDDLSVHNEYEQVVLDVNRSLKRFPPGIPLDQRVALQDQLTVLILRVIMKYPHLRYYQGYHDVAITFLLVVGETMAFEIMKVLSTNHFKECMAPTMEQTSYRLNYVYAIIQKVDKQLHDQIDRAGVGTMFALPWYLTWFGHSLNKYKDVVRLYDFFLASPPLMPLYVAAALVIYRKKEVMMETCDMASIHCLLSQIPDNLNFEEILVKALEYYEKYPPEKLEKDVKKRIQKELDQRKYEEKLRNQRKRKPNNWVRLHGYMPHWLMLHYRNKYGILFATATVLIGIYAYLKATEREFSFFKTWSL